ncbi:MAG: HlyC/CorC family transporter [Eubacterium sp.]|nr:HlyC/CorC family transporter [Eubacterium sp.]
MEDAGNPQRGFFEKMKRFFNRNAEDVTEEEIISLVNERHEQGFIRESEAEMIHNIFELGEKNAKDIMTHRKHICALDGRMTFSEAMDSILKQPYSRFPVYIDDMDEIIGQVHIKEVLARARDTECQQMPIQEMKGLLSPVDFVPETIGITALFQQMQKSKNHLVIVIDEYGQTAGLVALEDILEEIVGNIFDEHDKEEHHIVARADGSYLMDGIADLEEVAETLGLEELNENENDTLNGYLISLIDKIPVDGERFIVEAMGYQFHVLSVQDKMIRRVEVKKNEETV